MNKRPLLNKAEAAKRLGVTVAEVGQLIRRGVLATNKSGYEYCISSYAVKRAARTLEDRRCDEA